MPTYTHLKVPRLYGPVGRQRRRYTHAARRLDETPQESLARVVTEHPALEPHLSVATYDVDLDLGGRHYDWSHCFIFNAPGVRCRITPGTIIEIKAVLFKIFVPQVGVTAPQREVPAWP